jgi:uncharacterized protein YjbI with pentapeptide repeats
MNRFTPLLFAVGLLIVATPTQADIYQWEYINPFDHNEGKRQSTTLAPDGAGVDAVPNANLIRRNLTMAYLIGRDLTDARVYWSNLTGADLSQANLTNASFAGSTLTGAEFTGAEIRDANFSARFCIFGCDPGGTGLTLTQLYSTASYQLGDLRGIGLNFNDLDGGSFAGQNLTNGSFVGTDFTGASFRHANLSNANFAEETACAPYGCSYVYTPLTDADLTGVDTRGARLDLSGAITTNLIAPNGHVSGLTLNRNELLIVSDYDGNQREYPYITGSIPITINQHLTIGPGGTLRMAFETDAWDSMISFAPGIPVTLGGTLELTFADDVNLASHLGRTFDLFDWTGVTPTGAFTISSPYRWNLSNLYTTGQVTLTAIPEASLFAVVVVAIVGLVMQRRPRLPLGDWVESEINGLRRATSIANTS